MIPGTALLWGLNNLTVCQKFIINLTPQNAPKTPKTGVLGRFWGVLGRFWAFWGVFWAFLGVG